MSNLVLLHNPVRRPASLCTNAFVSLISSLACLDNNYHERTEARRFSDSYFDSLIFIPFIFALLNEGSCRQIQWVSFVRVCICLLTATLKTPSAIFC